MKKVTVEILVPKISCHKNDSFWYKDEEIAIVKYDGKVLSVMARGEIKVYFKPNGIAYKGHAAIEEANRLGYGDRRLARLSEHDGWIFNNWFEIFEVDAEGNLGDSIETAHEHDEAINCAKELIQDGY